MTICTFGFRLFLILLKINLLEFVRLPRWTFGKHVRSVPMISLKPSVPLENFWNPHLNVTDSPHLFHRAEEVTLGVSLNVQSKTSDIPDVPLSVVSSRYAVSLQDQVLASDIQLVSLHTYMEELSTSFNTQDQAPDDSYAQDRRCAPCIPRKGNHVFARLHTKQVISHFFLQLVSQDSTQELYERYIPPYIGFSRIEFQFCCL